MSALVDCGCKRVPTFLCTSSRSNVCLQWKWHYRRVSPSAVAPEASPWSVPLGHDTSLEWSQPTKNTARCTGQTQTTRRKRTDAARSQACLFRLLLCSIAPSAISRFAHLRLSMYVSTYLNIYIYIYDWCSMESLCRKVAASLLAHKPFFPPPLIIFYWNFGGVFQLPTIVRSLQVAWLGRARSNAKRTESLGHHPVGRRVAN